jgi:hypothetical protein
MPFPEPSPGAGACLALLLPGAAGRRERFWRRFAQGDAGCLEVLGQGALLPYAYARLLQEDPPPALPGALRARLRQAYLAAVHQEVRQKVEAVRVLGALVRVGVEVVLLKGADLRQRVYPEPGTRPMSDLDILTSPAQAGQARGVLRGLGYRLLEPEPRPGFRERFAHAEGWEPPAGATLPVDLHWEIREGAGYYRLPYEVLRPRLQESWNETLPLKVLSPEYLLIHLCLHTYFEFSHWRQLLDVLLVSQRLPVVWQQLAVEARACRCQAPVARVLDRLHGWQPDLIPSPARLGLDGAGSGRAEKMVLRGTWGPLIPYVAGFARIPRSDWRPFLAAKLWPDREYLAAKLGAASRWRYVRQFFHKFGEGHGE